MAKCRARICGLPKYPRPQASPEIIIKAELTVIPPPVKDRCVKPSWILDCEIRLMTSPGPPSSIVAITGTTNKAASMSRPCATSVNETPNNPPNTVYSRVKPATTSRPTKYGQPKVDSKNAPEATIMEAT